MSVENFIRFRRVSPWGDAKENRASIASSRILGLPHWVPVNRCRKIAPILDVLSNICVPFCRNLSLLILLLQINTSQGTDNNNPSRGPHVAKVNGFKMADIRRMYGKLCDVPNMYWNAIKVFTYPLECLCYVFWVIWAASALVACENSRLTSGESRQMWGGCFRRLALWVILENHPERSQLKLRSNHQQITQKT